jgi:hypothetical protein
MGLKLGLLPHEEGYELNMFENRLLRRIFGLVRELHNEDHNNSTLNLGE